MQPHGIGPVKQAIRTADAAKLRSWLLTHLDDASHTLRESFAHHAEAQGCWVG